MGKIIAFVSISMVLIVLSRKTLVKVKSHGFYRFLGWECMAWLLVNNVNFWFDEPWGIRQIFSWIFLFAGLYLVMAGVVLLKKVGKPTRSRTEESLYAFEKTAELIDSGIYHYIRHPLYASLIYLTWGIWLKNPAVQLIIFAVLSTFFLYLTAIFDEKECIRFFGLKYQQYMKHTKMFIPFVI